MPLDEDNTEYGLWKRRYEPFISFCPAARWAQTKHIDVDLYKNRMATPPLLPAAPPDDTMLEGGDKNKFV